jgi:biopolymer transport protein ExbB
MENAAPATAATKEVDNPYGPMQLWEQGGYFQRGILIVLLVMSFASWYIMLTRLWDQSRLRKSARIVEKQFWTAPSIKDGVERLPKGDDFRLITEDGLRATAHHDGRLTDRIDLNEWITMSLQRSVAQVNSRLQAGLSFLASVGSTAPFIGLLGTVMGILGALINIGVAGQADISKVAGPVGEALYMTAIGLIVAVPAVLGYNWLVRRNKVLQDQVGNFASDLHAYLLSGARVGQNEGGASRPAAAAPAAAVRK